MFEKKKINMQRKICEDQVQYTYITDVKAWMDWLTCEAMNKRQTNVKMEEDKLAKNEH
jgi:hypothetical protein